MRPSRQLAGRTALVTGVTSGIGRATAGRLVAAGATVVGCARDGDRLQAVARELPGLLVVPCDLRDTAQRADLVQGVLSRHGRVDVLVNNAAVGHVGAVVDLEADDVERVVLTGLVAYVDLARQVLPGMLERGDGDLLFVSSVAAWFAGPPLTLYSAVKRGVDGFVEGLRREVTPQGVRVHSVNPGPVATEFHARAVHLHPREGDPAVQPAPGVRPDRVARQVRDELERGRGRTVSVPRVAGVSRLAGQPLVSPVVDLVVRRFARRLEALGPQLADDRAGGFTSSS